MAKPISPARATSAHTHISIRGARTHNLKNLDLDIPRDALVVITGLSGSGKSSLAFDTLYAEGQRRYVESLSTYARQFLQVMDKPDVDLIEGLSPAISIEQKATSHNPRSTVGTVTEIHDYLRLLYARAGTPYCPEHDLPLQAQTVSQMVDAVLALPEGTRVMLLAPLAREKKGEFHEQLAQMQALGYVRFRIDGAVVDVDSLPELAKQEKHSIDVVIDRLKVRADVRQRLAESFEAALRLGEQRAILLEMDSGTEHWFNAKYACPVCNYSIAGLEPRLFSFNSPTGACPTCEGIGHVDVIDAQRVVAFPGLSLSSGAIKGWDRRNGYYFSLLESVCQHYQVDVDTPFEQLPEAVRHVILHGSGEEKIRFRYVMESGARKGEEVVKQHPFEGVIPNMERRYRDTESAVVREDLARYRSVQPCHSCHGTRLRSEARHVFVGEGEQRRAIYQIGQVTLGDAQAYFDTLELQGAKAEIADKVIREIANRLRFLNDVGLNYLSLERSAETLSGGEAQRIRLASQIGSGLTGVMYVLDEPSIGLHQRDNDRLIGTLVHLRNLGNSVLVVEHDEDMIRAADHVIDMGPGAGLHGGEVMAQGTCAEVMAAPESLTGQYLSGTRQIAVPARRTAWLPAPVQEVAKPRRSAALARAQGEAPVAAAEHPGLQRITVRGARGHNLKGVTVEIPVGLMTCVTGVSGSGKSSLVMETLLKEAQRYFSDKQGYLKGQPQLFGLEQLDKVIDIDQSPIGRTPRSNPATYTGVMTPIRELMARLPEARARGYKPGRFSFNIKGGRCETCEGDGVLRIAMHFLPDIYVSCERCRGRRYNEETLDIRYKEKNISEILNMTIEEALEFFQNVPAIQNRLQTIVDVGLGYLTLGQSSVTLSGGEAQRVKLAKELSRRSTGKTLYILDEPTTGLHFADIDILLKALHKLVDGGNTMVIIEHNLDVIKTADWIIDMGPEGGAGGGQIIAQGTPEQVAKNPASVTGAYLAPLLNQ